MANAVEELIGADSNSQNQYQAHTGGPSGSPSADSVARVELSFNIVAESYAALSDYVDGDISDKAIIVVDKSEEKNAVRRTVYTHLHHYLSSLYSFTEQAQSFINSNVGASNEIQDRILSPHNGDTPANDFVIELSYLLGLRHGLQHGDYQFLTFNQIGQYNNGDFTFHELQFRVPAFKNSSVRNPSSYLQYVSKASGNHQLPLCYINEFNSVFTAFFSDLKDWIDGNP